MANVKILYVSQEITPYLPETPMSLVCRNLPQEVQENGKEIRTFMPKFGCINERRNQLHEVIRLSGMNLIIDDTDHPLIIKVASIQSARMQVYFIDNDDYFNRRAIFTDENGTYFDDNDERAIFFARGVLETVKKLRWSPDIVHCHGWFTGLLPLYLKRSYNDDPLFAKSKIIYSIYNDDFSNVFDESFKKKVLFNGITDKDLKGIDKLDYIWFSKLAIDMSDGLIIGNENINPELKKYIDAVKKPVLSYQSQDEYIHKYSDFYDAILSN